MLRLIPDKRGPLRVLCVGAHSDDIEIGCGGTLLELTGRRRLDVTWVVLSAVGPREREAQRSAARFLRGARHVEVELQKFRDGFFPAQQSDIKSFFETLKSRPAPDVIFTHCRHDLHQDHRIVNELTWNTFRDHWILEYEIPKYDGDLGAPTLFVPLSKASARTKVQLLMRGFATQRSKRWFTAETFQALMRLRGVECHAESGSAEAFYARKTLI